ncbi:MAG: IS200/IS605 family transposase [Anditalea sp.]
MMILTNNLNPGGCQDNKINMADTFSQIYIQAVFAVKGRGNFLLNPWRKEEFKYMSDIIRGKGQKAIIVNGVTDHVHLFIGLKPSMAASDLVRDVKNNTSNFINGQRFLRGKFFWQDGYGVFSYSQIDQVYHYILNQEEHHRKKHLRKNTWDFAKF